MCRARAFGFLAAAALAEPQPRRRERSGTGTGLSRSDRLLAVSMVEIAACSSFDLGPIAQVGSH